MASYVDHAIRSAELFGGSMDDYIAIHRWFDETKRWLPSWQHRALRHHSLGILECIDKFGDTITNSVGDTVSVQIIAEQHIMEDCRGRVPTPAQWLLSIKPEKMFLPDADALEREYTLQPEDTAHHIAIEAAERINRLQERIKGLEEEIHNLRLDR